MNQEEIDILHRAIAREKASRKAAEKILELKSTELYEVNKKLEESHAELLSLYAKTNSQLQGVFENIVDAYVIMDLNGNILKMNDAAVNLLEFETTKDQANLMNLVDPSEIDKVAPKFKELMKTGTVTNFIIKIITEKGRYKLVHINASIIYENDVAVASQGIVRDITADREKTLMSELINDVAKSILGKLDLYAIAWEITRSIAEYLETYDCVIYVVDENKNTLEQIAAYGEKLNLKSEIDSKIEIPIGKGVVGTVAKTGVAEIINDTSVDSRYIVDDKRRLSEVTVPIISEGKVIGVIDSEHPERNYFTEKQLITLQNIASLVVLQLKSAMNLREKQKVENKNKLLIEKLAKSNDELQEYAHIVSHDLKSPLRSINALVNWIKEDNAENFDTSSLENFNLIELTLEKMESLITDILSYSSIDSDISESQKIDINTVINDVKQILFIPKHISIKVKNELPILNGERTKFQQLFQNLIGNAIKYNDKEKGLIEIDVSDEKSFYQFSIKDNGLGIEKKYHEKIFKIFHSFNKNKDSSGIGLSVVKKIVDLYQGEIWLESELNKGATFHFTIKKQHGTT
ncbi:MAG: histidine kinase [Bacteroidetes bacterium MedPE-SWsnd-G2]|nr:MAG: histidine kinase [Bacteroidetes bacterium MedPE-SWsnd-G2]